MKTMLVVVLTAFALIPSRLSAADYSWNNATGGDFNAGENWNPTDPPGPPGPSDRAIIDISLTDVIYFYNNTQTDQLYINLPDDAASTDVNLNLLGNTYTLHHEWLGGADDPAVVIGDSSAFTRVAIVHGVVDAYDCSIARLPSSSGMLVMLGDDDPATDERWTAFYHGMTIGDSGNGSLWIDHGAIVEHGHGSAGASIGGIGNITIRDVTSLWNCTGHFGLGVRGEGYLEVSQGASARIGRCVMGEARDDAGDAYGKGYATIDGDASTWELISGSEVSLAIGMEGDGSVTVRNQGYLHSYGHVTVAETKSGYGELTVSAGGKAEIEKSLSLGSGDFVNSDIKALVSVEGTGSQLVIKGRGAGDPNNPDPGDYVGLLVGKTTHGQLNVINGGHVINDYITMAGGEASSNGEIVVDGMNAHLHNKYRLEIGHLGLGQLNIANGGLVTVTCENADPELNEGTKGIVEVGQSLMGYIILGGHDSNGTPSSLISDSQIKVGVEGYGTVDVSGGARVESHANLSATNSAVIIGVYNNEPAKQGTGTVAVRDAGSIWTHDGTMNVGFGGYGTLQIVDGGRVESDYGIVARYLGSTGYVSVSGENSVWAISDSLVIGGEAIAHGGMGYMIISNFGKIELSNTIKIWEGSTLSFDPTAVISAESIEMAGGTLAGSGTIEPRIEIASYGRIIASESILCNSDVTGPGDLIKEGPGLLTINGNADYEGLTTIAEGTLQFNGATANLHDIVGDGDLGVGTDGSPSVLTATSIRVDTLTIGSSPDAATVPEPSAIMLLLLGAAAARCKRWRM